MDIKNINIQYNPIISNEPIDIDHSIIEKLFTEVEIDKVSDTKYLFEFHDKKHGVYQTEFDFSGMYTKYQEWSTRFLVYFAFMVAVNKMSYVFTNAILSSEDAEEFNKDKSAYFDKLRKKSFKFVLRMVLEEINEINNKTGKNLSGVFNDGLSTCSDYFINNIVKGVKLKRKESLALSLGLFKTDNYFIDGLPTCEWIIDQFNSTVKDDKIFIHNVIIKFDGSDDKLSIVFSSSDENTYKLIERDITQLQKMKHFAPYYFTSNDVVYKEPEIIKMGEYNLLKNGDETIYLTGSFIISPAEGYSLFKKSKLTVAGAERILNISVPDLQAKIDYALMTK